MKRIVWQAFNDQIVHRNRVLSLGENVKMKILTMLKILGLLAKSGGWE